MRAWWRRKSAPVGDGSRAERVAASDAAAAWLDGRHGVEVFVEPRTTVTGMTMLLVAHDGEFTRRQITSAAHAGTFARQHGLPIYDAQVVGYPQRMRDYSRRRTLADKRERRDLLDE